MLYVKPHAIATEPGHTIIPGYSLDIYGTVLFLATLGFRHDPVRVVLSKADKANKEQAVVCCCHKLFC
jgi:hypothetical protein